MVNDPIGDLLTRIRNAIAVKKESLELPACKQVKAVADLLVKRHFLAEARLFKEKGKPYKSIHLDLAYHSNGVSAISELKRISKPGQRIYQVWDKLPVSKGGKGLVIVSTSKGVMSSLDARKRHLGGEVWCEVF